MLLSFGQSSVCCPCPFINFLNIFFLYVCGFVFVVLSPFFSFFLLLFFCYLHTVFVVVLPKKQNKTKQKNNNSGTPLSGHH